jgi:hypothetical protein
MAYKVLNPHVIYSLRGSKRKKNDVDIGVMVPNFFKGTKGNIYSVSFLLSPGSDVSIYTKCV